MNRIAVVGTVLLPLALAARAAADRPGRPPLVESADGHTAIEVMPPEHFTEAATISPIIYMNRCVGGCTIMSSNVDNAATNESTIPSQAVGTPVPLSEFPYDDATWAFEVACVKEIYSPYNVQVTDVDPGPTVVHHEIFVAGLASELGLPAQYLGVSPVSGDHSPVNNNISFAFAAGFSNDMNINTPYGLYDLCATIGQETAHSWGLDHEYSCTDPMTYLNPCGGQKYFRNEDFKCGTAAPGDCNCDGKCLDAGPTQNSHQRILDVFGPGTNTTPGPTVALVSPADGSTVTNNFTVFVTSTAKRGTFKLKMLLNGYDWFDKQIPDNAQGGGQSAIYAPSFSVQAPNGVPDGVIDVEVDACDDLDQCAPVKLTVTKGAPCTSAATCATGQKCEAGKCFWDPPSKMVGDTCTFSQECVSGICGASPTGGMVCTQTCFQAQAGSCPMGLTCQLDATNTGYCLPEAPAATGCCQSGGGGDVAPVAMSGLVLVLTLRRRRGAA